jgi:Transposase
MDVGAVEAPTISEERALQTITTLGLVVPQFLAFKLLKEIKVITGERRRQRWTGEEKARIVAESFEEDANISEVPDEHRDLESCNLLHLGGAGPACGWRR